MTDGSEAVAAPSAPTAPWARRVLAAQLVGIALGIILLYVAMARFAVETETLAFGRETANNLGGVDGNEIHCIGADDSKRCLDSWEKAGKPPTVMWFGNSQLAAINRMQRGDENAPQLLFRDLRARGKWLVTYAQPNANLSEQALVYTAVAPVYRPQMIILPVCYDDFREQGIRDIVGGFADDPAVAERIRTSSLAAAITPFLGNKTAQIGTNAVHTEPTTQDKVEAWLNGELNEHWSLWRARPQLRGTMGAAIHLLRNKAMGIHSTTKRPVDPTTSAQRMKLLASLVARMRADGIDVIVYLPPYRQDIDGPYVAADYARFKSDLERLATQNGARFANYENLVDGPQWATVTDDIFGFREPDFMHFTATGHKKLAAALDRDLQQAGY